MLLTRLTQNLHSLVESMHKILFYILCSKLPGSQTFNMFALYGTAQM